MSSSKKLIEENRKLDFISFNSWIFITNEQKLWATYHELFGIVYWPTIYEQNIFGSNHFLNVLIDRKPILSCFLKKGNLSLLIYNAQMQLTKSQKLRSINTKGKNLSVADMLGRSGNQNELQLNQRKHKQLPPQIHFATLTHDKQIKPEHYLVEHETVLPSQKDDWYPISPDFGKDHFSIRPNAKGGNIKFKPLDSFSFEAVKPFQRQNKNPIKKLLKYYYNTMQFWMIPISLINIIPLKSRY